MEAIAGEITDENKCWDILGTAQLGANFMETWTYQTCTELPMPIGSTNDPPTDIFNNAPFSWEAWNAECQTDFGVTLRKQWEAVEYGMYNGTHSDSSIQEELRYASNIIFTNGAIDPWSVGGIKGDLDNPNLSTLLIEQAAHCLDLSAPNNRDTESVKAARKMHVQHIEKWLK
jgi:lysosomal Pro-X carboxypeptidase